MTDERGGVVRCPFCGAWTYEEQVESPSDYCHHDEVPSPQQAEDGLA